MSGALHTAGVVFGLLLLVLAVWWVSSVLVDAGFRFAAAARREWVARRVDREIAAREDFDRRIGRWLS